MDYNENSIKLHSKHQGKIAIQNLVALENSYDLSLAYTPGVAAVCKKIHENPILANELTLKGRTVAVISDGSAVLGLGNIGPLAAMPVMEGKCALFKKFANIDAFPICLATQDTEEIIKIIKSLEPTFGGINLEDISAPRCFEIEKRLTAEMNIPIFHDDQHGTAIVVLAGLINALKLVKKDISQIKIAVSGSGAAGTAILNLLYKYGARNFIVCDSKGILSKNRKDLNQSKIELLAFTNVQNLDGQLSEALIGSDVFLGISSGNILTQAMVRLMNPNPIIFAMANPLPEIMPDEAYAGGAAIVATGRSDFPNQINNVLAFPGVFKGVFKSNRQRITDTMKIAAAKALADHVKNPTTNKIIPHPFDEGIVDSVSEAIQKA
jgi:malate dehydrogenase (oxaloacetate-decarboxylating)